MKALPTSAPRATLLALGAIALVIALSLLIPGCFENEPGFQRDRDATLQLTLDEFRIIPANLRVRPGRVHIVARNKGEVPHNVKVESIPEDTEDPDAEVISYGGTATTLPGDVASASVPLTPGRYRLTCTIANHDTIGQFGTLVVDDYGEEEPPR